VRATWRLLLGGLFVAGCGFEPTGAIPMTAPPVYREWWAKTEACSGLSGDFDLIRFATVPGPEFECPSGTCVGRWEPGHHIYLAEAWSHHEMVVRHEMLHELLRGSGHPDPPFGHGCPLTWATWPGPGLDAVGSRPLVE
jgi:hypothetical protein